MRRVVPLAIVTLAVFLVLLLARFPARWAESWLPEGIECERLSGTVWSGRCSALTVGRLPLGEARWNVRASRLLAARLAAVVALSKPGLDVRGTFETGLAGSLRARDVRAVLALSAATLPQVPPNTRGTLRADLARLAVEGGVVEQVEGRIEALSLAQGGLALGDYALTFPAGAAAGEPVGTLEDLRGPLDVNGTLRLTREPGWFLEGRVAARPDAPPELARQLQYLGSPDASGRRPFSLAGTL